MRTSTKYVIFVVLGICIGIGVWCSLGRPTLASQDPGRPILSKLPPIKTCLQHVKLVKAELVMQGDSQVASLQLENEAYIGVTAVSVEAFDNKTKYSVVKSAFSPDKEPLIIIPPGEKATMTIGNLSENSRIRIASVMFSDGTEEGCESSLKTVRQIKDRDTKKGGPEK